MDDGGQEMQLEKDDSAHAGRDTAGVPEGNRIRKVAFASFVGTAIEYYDLYIYATAAALVFGTVFFPNSSDAAGTLASFATFAVAYVVRPLGGIIFGHFGDRFGRKRMLVVSLTLMGSATFLIGLVPSYSVAGVAAPMLLVALRLLQGIGVGGEWGGAVLLSAEHAPRGKRAFYASWVQMGAPVGFMLSSATFLVVNLLVSQEQFLAWGWRMPFVASAILVLIGLYVRFTIAESPEFERAAASNTRVRLPIVTVFRQHLRAIVFATSTAILPAGFFSIVLVYVVRDGTARLGLSASTMLVCTIVANVFFLVSVPFAARLADRLGRNRVAMTGAAALGVWIFPMFALINTAQPMLVTVALSMGMPLLALCYAPMAAIMSDAFSVSVRYSGTALSYNLSSILGSGLAPIVAAQLFATTGSTLAISFYVLATAVLAVASLALLRPARDESVGEFDAAVEAHR